MICQAASACRTGLHLKLADMSRTDGQDFTFNDQQMSSKTVLMIAPLFPPASGAGVHRTVRFAKYLSEFGWKVVVVTKTLPGGAEDQPTSALQEKIPSLEHVEVIRVKDPRELESIRVAPEPAFASRGSAVPLPASPQRKPVKRASFMVTSGKNLLRPVWQFVEQTPDMGRGWSRAAAKAAILRCRRGDIDVVYSTGPPHSGHLAARRVGKAMHIPFVADFRDPWARNSWIRKRNPIGRRVLPLLESLVVKSAAKVIANNEGSLASFQAAYPTLAQANRFLAITNGFDPEMEVAAPAEKPDTPVITAVHAGSFYVQRDPRPVVAAIAELVKSGVKIEFHHIGTFDAGLDPVAIARELGCESSVRWFGKLSHAETLKRLSGADLLVAIQPNAPFQIPGKVFEMLLFDQPIVAVCESPPTEQVVQQAGGTTAPSHDIDRIVQAIQSAIAMRGSAELKQRRADARTKYNGRELTRVLATVLDNVVEKSAP